MVGPIVRSNVDRNLFVKRRSAPTGLSAAAKAHEQSQFIAITNVFVQDRNGDVGPKAHSTLREKKARSITLGYSATPAYSATGHPIQTGCPLSSHPTSTNIIIRRCAQQIDLEAFRRTRLWFRLPELVAVFGANRLRIVEAECANRSEKLFQI